MHTCQRRFLHLKKLSVHSEVSSQHNFKSCNASCYYCFLTLLEDKLSTIIIRFEGRKKNLIDTSKIFYLSTTFFFFYYHILYKVLYSVVCTQWFIAVPPAFWGPLTKSTVSVQHDSLHIKPGHCPTGTWCMSVTFICIPASGFGEFLHILFTASHTPCLLTLTDQFGIPQWLHCLDEVLNNFDIHTHINIYIGNICILPSWCKTFICD